MNKYILCFDKDSAEKLKIYLNLLFENNGFYYFEYNENELNNCMLNFENCNYQIVDKLMLDI